MVAEGAALRAQRVEDGGCRAYQALAVRDERPAIPGQEELPIWRIPAAAPAPEEPSLLQGQARGFSLCNLCNVAEELRATTSTKLLRHATELPADSAFQSAMHSRHTES